MTANPTLEQLREEIDEVDRKTLDLLGRRSTIVQQMAELKRELGAPIRDLDRERELLAERAAQAEILGLPSGVIESIYRQLLVASRDAQAGLGVGISPDSNPRRVAVIGGLGSMGRRMAELFSDLGHDVSVADVETPLTPVDAAKSADVVVMSVPIAETERSIKEIGPHLRSDALLMDVTSVKARPMQVMMESSAASVVGTHPMFGPGVHSLTGQRIVVCPGRGEGWLDWVRTTLRARGLVITEAAAEEHDRIMAVVQVLNHFQTQVLGLALARMGLSLERTLAFTSPAYLLELYVAARHFAQSPDLYGAIEMQNPAREEVTTSFRQVADELAQVLLDQDLERFRAMFAEVREYFGDFTEEALEQSRFLIDRLVELTAGRAAR